MTSRFFYLSLICLAVITSCSKVQDFTVFGTVKGLKKGTLYLQKIKDSTLVNLDSLTVNGDPNFKFHTELKEPQILYLHLDKKDGSIYNDRIIFFAEPGEMNITTTLKGFDRKASITGSQNQVRWTQFEKINKQFNITNINLMQSSFKAQKNGRLETVSKYRDSIKTLQQRRYRYIGNFAITNKEYAIAPYLVLTQIPDASTSYLDTIYKSFPPKNQQSIYGKQLAKILQNRSKK